MEKPCLKIHSASSSSSSSSAGLTGMDRSCHTKQIAISVVWTGAERQESTRQESSGTATASWVKVLHFHVLYNKANTIRRFPLYGDGQGSGGGGTQKPKAAFTWNLSGMSVERISLSWSVM